MSCQQVLLCLTYVVFTFHARREECCDLLSGNFTSLSSCHFCGILGKNWAAIFFSDFCPSLAAWHHWHTVCLASQTHARRRMQIFLSLALVGFSQFMSSLRFMVDWLIFGLSSVLHSKICMLCFVKCPVKASCNVWQFQVGFGSQNWGMLYLLYICHFSARDVVSLVALSLQIILCW